MRDDFTLGALYTNVPTHEGETPNMQADYYQLPVEHVQAFKDLADQLGLKPFKTICSNPAMNSPSFEVVRDEA